MAPECDCMGQLASQNRIRRGFYLSTELRYPKTYCFNFWGRAVSAFLDLATTTQRFLVPLYELIPAASHVKWTVHKWALRVAPRQDEENDGIHLNCLLVTDSLVMTFLIVKITECI
jgi:hypothetical protein